MLWNLFPEGIRENSPWCGWVGSAVMGLGLWRPGQRRLACRSPGWKASRSPEDLVLSLPLSVHWVWGFTVHKQRWSVFSPLCLCRQWRGWAGRKRWVLQRYKAPFDNCSAQSALEGLWDAESSRHPKTKGADRKQLTGTNESMTAGFCFLTQTPQEVELHQKLHRRSGR